MNSCLNMSFLFSANLIIFLCIRFCSLRYEAYHSFSGPMNLYVLSSEICRPIWSRYSFLRSDIVSETDLSKVFFHNEKVVLSIFYFIYVFILLYLGIWKIIHLLNFGKIVIS